MTLSRGAIGNLVNRYRAVLRKCRMMNVFGSLAVAGMLVAGNAGFAGAEELSGDISPISLSGDTRNIIGVGDISLRSTEPALRYLINVSGQGQLDISMSNGSPMAVGNADGIYLKDYSEYDQYASAFHVAGSGSSGSFVGTGTFSMVGGGKLLGVCAFLSESKGTLTLSGDITGEAEAVMNGSNGYASFAAAAAGGNLVFGGDRTTLRAKASTGNNANGAFVKYGGMIDFASKSVLIESKNTDSSSVGINCADGTVKTSADTDLDIVVEGNKATTGIQLTASSSDVQLAGNLDLTATQTGQDSFASVLGISNDSGKMVVSGPTSLRLATNAPFDAKGITASGKADMSFLGDVEIAVTGSASGSALYTTYRYDYSTQAGICPVISLGTDGKAVALNSSGYGINNQGGSVSLTGQRINITGSTGVFVEGGGNENVFADVRFDGPTTINADKAIVTSIKAGEQVGASVTFAYNPTPINVPVTKESADSKVRGSVTGSSGTINKENAGSLAFYGDISNFSGVFNQKGGTTFLSEGAAGYFGKAQLAVTGGALVAPTLSFQKTGKLTLAGGTLETGTGQIFTSALNADGDMKDPGAVKLSDSNWKFDSGVIAFDDAKYNIVYAQTAAGLLGAGNVAADNVSGSGSAKEITFTGTLVELPPGDPDSFETLQKAVLDTGIDSIKLGSDIVLSKRLQGTTPVARSLAIDGNGHTISGAYPGLWFKGMDSGTVSIQNIAFDGLKTSSGDRYEGPVSFGPAIFFDMGYFADNWKSTAKLIIGDGVQFRNTESVGDGAGGAVRTAHGIVEIGNNVGFINCTGGSGGGLYSESFTTIGDNVVFEGNKGRRGGALNVVDDYEDYLTDPDYASGARRVKYVHIGKNALFKNNSVELLGSGGNGGAIEVQSGELSIDDGATFTGNTSKSTGGAIAVCDWSPQLPAKAVLGSATFTQNSAGSYGGAIINEGDVRFNGPVSFVENTAGKIGGAVCNLNTLNMAAESTFSKNTAGVGGGFYNEGIASLGKASFIENAAADGGGAVFNVHQLTFADGAVFSGNSATDGGAVYNDFSEDKDGNAVSAGSLAFNGGARFIGNTASGLGGAIYNTRSITLNPGAGQEIVFSGNTDSTGSNAIFMGDGSSLDITGDGKVVFNDALSSQSATPALKKTGSGELLLNASMDGFLGTAAFEDGRTEIAQKWLIKNTVTITGGRLKMPAFSFVAQGEGNNVAGGKLILAGGILETGTGQIFINGLNAEGDNKDPGAVKLSGDNWSFDSGLIAFNDALYNLTYAQAAADSLGANNVEAGEGAGSTSAKEITFIGTGYVDPVPDPVPPVEPDPDPVPPVDPGPDPVPPVEPDPTPPAPEPKPDEDRTGKVSVDELNNNHANNIVLGNVTITTGTSSDSGKDFVVGASAKDDKTDSISGSIGGKNIDLGSSGRNISVVGGHYLTLVGGSSDTPLVTAGGNPVNVHVGGTGEGASGVLNLGTPVMDSGGTLSGNIEIAAASTVNVRAGTHVITGEANETTGTADVAGMNNNGGTINIAEGAHLQSTIRQADGQTNVSGKLTSASVELSGGALNVSGAVDSSSVTASKGDIKVAGTLAADVLTTSSDVQLNIGDQGSAGRVVARQAQLQGGRVFLDPAWKGNDALADASHGVFTFVNNEIDGLLTAGQNSLLVLGDTDTGWALDAFGRSSLQWGQNGVTAALAIRKPQTLNGTLGAVMVDGTKTSAPVLIPNTATFADGSLLLVDGSGLNGAAALTSQGGTLNVDAGAKLLIDNITQGEYAITSGFSVSNVQGWNGDNLSTPDNLIGLVLGKDADGSMKVQATARRSSDVFRGLSLVNTMDAIWGRGLNDTESGNMGIRFLSRAVNENHLPKADTVHTVDGAAQIAVAGGVQGMAVAAADAPVRAIQDHASLSHMTTTREGAIRKDGLNLWINALYGAEHARNLGAGSLDGGYNADFGGIVFGGDYAFGDFRVGMALNAGSGTARSRGDFNATKNDFDFWGMNLYGSWSRDQFNIVGDLGYSANKNEVKQDLPTTMQLGQLRADVDTGVLTAGLRGEYRFETDWADVTPHVGVRYYNLRTDGFTSRIDDHDVFRVGRDTQEIWTFPIGVSFSRDFETSSGWKVKPRADLSVAPAAGDLKAKTKVRVPGVAASDTIKARMMDSVSFDGTLGLEVQKDNISFGLDYGIRASEHKAGHGVNVSFTYKF
ncbi:polymorphic outer membrane protein [Bilophila wadsworthia 3_1_6]|uniref:Polymorphic outer membrane protein n=1 Tax=Bilophila wadsworthia (strain 3_1_6) TaxID=563192 RepID=E5YBP0_BILW3|nr:polymorphic outer membrane protein [Bilophila wadsworthia 3_1_6]